MEKEVKEEQLPKPHLFRSEKFKSVFKLCTQKSYPYTIKKQQAMLSYILRAHNAHDLSYTARSWLNTYMLIYIAYCNTEH